MSHNTMKRINSESDESDALTASQDSAVDVSPVPKRSRKGANPPSSPTRKRTDKRAVYPLVRQRSGRLFDNLSVPTLRKEHGKVYVLGSGETGQLGLGEDILSRKKPMPLNALEDEPICDVVCGGLHSIALTTEGKLWSWGCNDQRALGRSGEECEPGEVEGLNDIRIVKVACGDSISLALSEQGKIYSWGTYRSSEGALGFSKDKAIQDIPQLFEPLSRETIVDIAAGTDHCLALTDSGRVYSWGNGQQYQLGRRIIERRKKNGLFPEPLALKNIKAIGTGAYHSFALSQDNKLYAWGLNNYNQCGMWTEKETNSPDYVMEPTVIPALENKGPIRAVTAGEHHSFVLMESGHVYAFGRADSSQLGLPTELLNELERKKETGAPEDASKFKRAIGIPTQIPSLSNVKQIASGSNHAIAVTENGLAYTWGFGEMLALGTGTEDDAIEPTLLTGQKLDGHEVLRVSAGAQHTVLVAK